MTKFQPAIKWSGSKRSQAEKILEHFPLKIKTYYEPFVGGASILMGLLLSNKQAEKYVCSDTDKNLINLWKEVSVNPARLAREYYRMWHELNVDGDTERKKEYYYSVRKRFNETHKTEDFLFIMRTCVNGMVRYNLDGQFNNAFHITRNGMKPETLEKILLWWSYKLQENAVEFLCRDFSEIESREGDFIYLDPPYANTKGMYGKKLDNSRLWEWMEMQSGEYCLSYDGKIVDGDDMTYKVPEKLFSKHIYLESGNSSFRRTIGKSKDSIVFESLYLK